jgi:hypothetical protein
LRFRKTYRYIIASCFAILLFAETFNGVFLVAGYYSNTQAFAVNCINKDKPQMHCNGKCQLQKKMDETNNKDRQNTERRNETGLNILSSKSFFASIESLLDISIKQKYFIADSVIPLNNSSQFFHPPQTFFM